MYNFFPKIFTNKAIAYYFGALALVSVLFFKNILPLQWMLFGSVEVIGYFYFANKLTLRWRKYSPRFFEKKLLKTSFILRLIYVLFSYVFYLIMTGKPFEFQTGDAFFYHDFSYKLSRSALNFSQIVKELGASDSGYVIYLAIIKKIFGNDILVTRFLKAFFSAFTCVLIYRLSTRTFGEQVARVASVFCMLMPNLIFYTGLHLKEVEMIFLTVWCLERADLLVRNKKFTFQTLLPTFLLVVSLFFFRTVLGATVLFALFTTIIFSSSRILNMGKRMMLIVWVSGTIVYFIGGSIATEVQQVWGNRQENQQVSMQWRSEREGGNKFAKYAGGAVFAPMIFVIPFPTMVNVDGQENQMIINGGNYVKNIMAFFTIFAIFWIVKNKKWRDYLLIGSFTIGYLLVIAMSAFAQSERFHQPVLPFELVFAAFGISLFTKKTKKYFTWYLAFIFVVLIGWSWFKLAGRGMA